MKCKCMGIRALYRPYLMSGIFRMSALSAVPLLYTQKCSMFEDLFVWFVSEVSMCFGYTRSALTGTLYVNIM